MLKTISEKLFPLQITKKVYLWMLLIIIFPTAILSVITYLEFLSIEEKVVKHRLFESATELSKIFEETFDSYTNILSKENINNLSIDQRVKLINSSLQPIINKYIQENKGIGVGFYSISLNHVVAYGPNFTPSDLKERSHSLPFFKTYQTGKPEYTYFDNSLTWKNRSILNLSYPIYHNKKIIGHIWCNIKLNDIYFGAFINSSKILLVGLIISGFFIILSWRFFTRFKNELEKFAHSVSTHDNNNFPEGILPELTALLKMIKQSENKYRTIFENTGTAMTITDKNNILSLVNTEFCKLTGYSKEEIEGKKCWTEFVHDDYLEKLHVYYKRLSLTEEETKPKSIEFKLVDKIGRVKDIFLTIALIPGAENYVASLLDITEQKRSEQELMSSMDRFYKTFRSTPSSMSITRLSDDKFIDINNGFYLMTGYTFDEVYNRTRNDIKLWKYPEEQAKMIECIKNKGCVNNLEMIFITKSGEERDGLLSAEKIELDGEECIIILVMDITERKQLIKDMKQLDRLNLVGEMAAGIGHEIRNPMTTVRGFLQLMTNKDEYSNDRTYFDLMIDELDRANSIIKEYLTLAKNKSVDLVPMNLNDIINTLFPLIQADAIISDKYVQLDLNHVENLLLDQKEIRQLILNLTRNGIEAMSKGGTVTIRTYMEKGRIVASFQDQGTGIAPDIMEKMGTPFFTTKEYGTGLGLAVCYSVAARHNAVIKIEPNTSGTTFKVIFENTINQKAST